MPLVVYPISQAQADSLRGQLYAPDSYFNPIQDGSGQWFISPEEWQAADKTLWPFLIGINPVEYVEPISPNPHP